MVIKIEIFYYNIYYNTLMYKLQQQQQQIQQPMNVYNLKLLLNIIEYDLSIRNSLYHWIHFLIGISSQKRFDSVYKIGIYDAKSRKQLLNKFHKKRLLRISKNHIRYKVRQNLAHRRVRINGRFVKAVK